MLCKNTKNIKANESLVMRDILLQESVDHHESFLP